MIYSVHHCSLFFEFYGLRLVNRNACLHSKAKKPCTEYVLLTQEQISLGIREIFFNTHKKGFNTKLLKPHRAGALMTALL